MRCSFVKYQATGNDFIVFNNINQTNCPYDSKVIQRLCHRQFGIGADGVIMLEQQVPYDFAFAHYNADGSKGGGLCGNGSRVALHYAYSLGLIDQKAYFGAIDGGHKGVVKGDNLAALQLKDVQPISPLHKGYYVHNGTRHYVEIVEQVMEKAIESCFEQRYMPPFEKQGINLNFVEIQKNTILVRTCECGLNTEPLACGTGAVASALVVSSVFGLQSPIEVITKGGKLSVQFSPLPHGGFTDIWLSGSVFQTFCGVVDLKVYQDNPSKT